MERDFFQHNITHDSLFTYAGAHSLMLSLLTEAMHLHSLASRLCGDSGAGSGLLQLLPSPGAAAAAGWRAGVAGQGAPAVRVVELHWAAPQGTAGAPVHSHVTVAGQHDTGPRAADTQHQHCGIRRMYINSIGIVCIWIMTHDNTRHWCGMTHGTEIM